MLLNCGVGEDSWESLGLQGDPTSPSSRKSVLNIHWKDGCWSWNSNTLATWCEELTHWKRPWCWERLKAGGEGDDRGWDGGWHHRLNGHEFESTLGVGEGQGGLACCSPWGHKESDTTEQLNWTESENDNLSLSFNFCIIFFHFSHKKKLLGTAGILPQATNENSQIILLAFYSVNMALKIKHYKGNPV